MSANPTRVDWDATVTAETGSPLQEGNRVLESIARQEALNALFAFSQFHERIRNRRGVTGWASDRDLLETERFILDEVLQLICDRAQAITQSDAIVIALPEEPKTERRGMVCRAAAGTLTIARGVRLIGESEFLQDCLASGRILRCDDCEIDARAELDFARVINARSSVLVPLRGRREQLGVLQAFSTTAWAFTDQDIRCLELFAELVLSALKPEDQDRRIHWLADVAGEILQMKSGAATAVADAAPVAPLKIETIKIIDETAVSPPSDQSSSPATLPVTLAAVSPAALSASPPVAALPSAASAPPTALRDAELHMLTLPVFIPVVMIELSEPGGAEQPHAERPAADEPLANEPFDFQDEPVQVEAPAHLDETSRPLAFPRYISLPDGSRPGLNVVIGLVAIAALFSAGAWWGMQVHGKPAGTKAATTGAAITAISPPSATKSAPASEEISVAISDNLMNPEKAGSEATPLTAVAEDKLAALPKITGVRHWSSSLGSTVVIDMEDQVPYEVHRLMSPERIYFDLHDTVLPPELAGKTMDVGDASLSRVRVAQPVAGVTRIVLDTRDGSNFSVSMESNPYRLVVELRNSEKTLAANHGAPAIPNRMAASANAAPAVAKMAPAASLDAKVPDQPVPAKTGKFRVVLDAGHGGWDLGTVGRQGLMEKDLVLDVTQRLGRLLQVRLGCDVMFTRTGDTYLPLDQRADFANRAQADVFVSIHANYSSSAAARGVETYYTNLFSAPGSREVEKHDDGTFATPTPISLSAGALHDKIEESQRLAATVQHSLYGTLAANSPDIRDRGIKDAAYVVLTGTTMPAILTEISFVSSPADERNLLSSTYRQQIAEALYQGIARYQQSAPHAKIAKLQTSTGR